MPGPTSFFSITRTFAPFSAAEQAAKRPEVPAPTTRTSQSSVSTMSPSAISGAAPSHAGASVAAGAWSASASAGAQARAPAAEAVAIKPRRETFWGMAVMLLSFLLVLSGIRRRASGTQGRTTARLTSQTIASSCLPHLTNCSRKPATYRCRPPHPLFMMTG